MRLCVQILQAILLAALIAWVAISPLVWILRDGLGPACERRAGGAARSSSPSNGASRRSFSPCRCSGYRGSRDG
jgi:hypothetical protein